MRGKLQDMNINQLNVEVYDSYKKVEKITADFEPSNNENVINKNYVDENLLKINGYLSLIKKRLQRV